MSTPRNLTLVPDLEPGATPRLPRELMAGGTSVALIARDVQPGVLAHKPFSLTRTVERRGLEGQKETYYVAACAAGVDDPDEAYLLTAAWADHRGAVACTEPACFPIASQQQAVASRG